MLAAVCLLAMTGGSFLPDWQLASDRVIGVVQCAERTTVLFEEAGELELESLPKGLRERIRRSLSLDKYYPPEPGEERLRELLDRELLGQFRENGVFVLPPYWGAQPAQDSVPYMPNFYRKGDPIPYIPNFFTEGDLDRYWPGFSQSPAPFPNIPQPNARRDEQMLKGLWDRFGKRPIITPLEPGDKLP